MIGNRVLSAAAILVLGALPAMSQTAELAKVSNHFYFMSTAEGGFNVGAVVTNEGVLLIDPPAVSELQAVLEALKKITAAPVRWVVHTNYHRVGRSGYEFLIKQGAILLTSRELDRLAFMRPVTEEAKAPAGQPAAPKPGEAKPAAAERGITRFIFDNQIRLFPENVEVRIIALQHKAITAGDVLVCLPAEKVIQAGEIFVAGSFPDIDMQAGGGDALGWLEGMKQAVATVPVLKSAMPQPKPELPPLPPEMEKTLEELVFVIPGRGPISNLKEMKDLLNAAQKLRAQAARAVAAKRELNMFLYASAMDEFRGFDNLEPYAQKLFHALSAAK